jgi:hypothetical protein
MDPMTAFVSAEIFDDEPWRPCGRQTPSRERRKFVRRVIPMRSGISLALSHQRMAVNAGPAGAGQGRQPAKPGARSASLDGRRLVRQRRSSNHGLLLGDVLSGCPGSGVRRHTLRVEETKSECRQKVEHSYRE